MIVVLVVVAVVVFFFGGGQTVVVLAVSWGSKCRLLLVVVDCFGEANVG